MEGWQAKTLMSGLLFVNDRNWTGNQLRENRIYVAHIPERCKGVERAQGYCSVIRALSVSALLSFRDSS